MKKIIIGINNGGAFAINIPKDTEVEIRDYDINDPEWPGLKKDSDGYEYQRIILTNEDSLNKKSD